MSAITSHLMTAEDLVRLENVGRCELIYGELIMMSPAGFAHGEIAIRIGRFVGEFVDDHDLGAVLGAETGYLIETDPDLVRAPDVSFVRKDRLPRTGREKFYRGVPDLAVEVKSPDDSRRYLAEKVNMWLAHGVKSVWVADPATMTLTVYRTAQEPVILLATDELRDDAVLPGFVLPLAKVFKRPC